MNMSNIEKYPVDSENGQISKKLKTDVMDPEDICSSQHTFDSFVVETILRENSQDKLAFIQGHFKDREGKAVVILERTPFNEESVEQILSKESETKCTLKNDIYRTLQLFPPKECSDIKTTLVYPATQKHIAKYQDQEVFLVQETADDYKNITLPCLEASQFSIQWVYNILEKTTEADRIVFEDSDPDNGFILLPDMKWDRKHMDNLYLIAIVKKHGIRSLRDLKSDHLPLLRNILQRGQRVIKEEFDVGFSKLRIFIHYQPSYYHFHVHFTHLKFQAPGSGVERAHLLTDVIDNIERDRSFYQTKTLAFPLQSGNILYKHYTEAGKL